MQASFVPSFDTPSKLAQYVKELSIKAAITSYYPDITYTYKNKYI